MSIPLEKLIDTDKNIYEMTCVAIKEASIISHNPDEVEKIEENGNKLVSSVLTKVLNNEVEYTTGE